MSKRLRDQDLTTRPRITVTETRLPYSGLLFKVEALDARNGKKLKREGNFATCLYYARRWAKDNESAYTFPVAA